VRTLDAYGFEWDGPVLRQSRRKDRYREVLDGLVAAGDAYPCACTRRKLVDAALAVDGAAIYPGTCRQGLPPGKAARAWRLRVDQAEIDFDDALKGRRCQQLARDVGDFVLLRADGYFAYQLAVVVDDADQGVTHVVRGADLLDSTPRQIFLQRCLGWPTLAYAHLPLVVDAAGEKLSKQTRAPAIDVGRAAPTLVAALAFLGQSPPAGLAAAALPEVWAWARAEWRLARVPAMSGMAPGQNGMPIPTDSDS
jgi:glutamyl-Q tRNA(Asp) synthetase